MADQKVKEMEPVETQIVEIMPPDIENLIYVVRNKQVMVDSDLAMLYQVETKALNRAVKRNIKRFPEDALQWYPVKASSDRLNFDSFSDNLCEENHTCQVAPSAHRIYR